MEGVRISTATGRERSLGKETQRKKVYGIFHLRLSNFHFSLEDCDDSVWRNDKLQMTNFQWKMKIHLTSSLLRLRSLPVAVLIQNRSHPSGNSYKTLEIVSRRRYMYIKSNSNSIPSKLQNFEGILPSQESFEEQLRRKLIVKINLKTVCRCVRQLMAFSTCQQSNVPFPGK